MLHSRDLKNHDKKKKEDGNQNLLTKHKWNMNYIYFNTYSPDNKQNNESNCGV
jgi:hypothetical protein